MHDLAMKTVELSTNAPQAATASAAGKPRAAFKYVVLDFYRFLAASLVVVYHLNIGMGLGIERAFPGILSFKYFVDFFFILSGFVIALTYADHIAGPADYRRFLGRRIARIYPLHLATLLIFALAGHLALSRGFAFDRPEYFAPRWLWENLLLVQAWGFVPHRTFNGPAWSISAELFVYLLFPVFALLARRLPVLVNAALAVAFVGAMILVRAAFALEPWHIATNQAGMLRAVPTFFAGVLIARAILDGHRLSQEQARLGTIVSLAAVLLAMALDLAPEVIIGAFVPLVYFTAMLETTGTLPRSRWMETLGNASYAIYMLQMGLIAFATILARKTVGLEGINGFLVAGGTYLAILLLAIPTYRWFENPARHLIQRAFDKA